MIASMPKVPSPGMAKSVSTTMAPPIRKPTWRPITVTVGIRAFFSACLNTTGRSPRPLARAVVTYSVRMTSSMLARSSRVRMAARPMPSATAGIRTCCMLPQRLTPHTMVGQVPGR